MSTTEKKAAPKIDKNTEALLTGIHRYLHEELDKARAQLRAEVAVLRADLTATRSELANARAELAAVRAEVAAQRSAGITSPARRLANSLHPATAPRI
ncbi:hypothetical protein [Neoroseomonas soli]|uniref:Uncharacterized protein n=1 Tax=Neoroseomonas soli TaxID=1081025 RepID=A0A9X9WYL3_9PROT|nr:hypothetical protein [Neoroseomonas soli]MBR0672242.1 hypothetical protein [Neoroseomonas soli]